MILSLVLFAFAALLFVYAIRALWSPHTVPKSGRLQWCRSPDLPALEMPTAVREPLSHDVSTTSSTDVASSADVGVATRLVSNATPILESSIMAAPVQRGMAAEKEVTFTLGTSARAVPQGHPDMHLAGTGRGAMAAWGTCLSLFIFAVTVRWWDLPGMNMEMWGDEAQLMGEARKFIDGTYTTPFLIDHLRLSALYEFVMSFPLRLSGMDVTVARGYSGVLGALSVPLLYLTARELGYSRRVGIVAGLALATTFWDMLFSRFVLPNIMAASAGSIAVLLMVMAVRRSNVIWAALAGVGVAYALNAHLSGFFVAPLMAVWLVVLIVGYSRWWRRRPRPRLDAVASPQAILVRLWLFIFAGWDNNGDDAAMLDLSSPMTRPRPSRVFVVALVLGISSLIAAWPLLQLYFGPGSSLNGHASGRFLLSADNRAAFAAGHPDVGSSLPGLLWYQLKATAVPCSIR